MEGGTVLFLKTVGQIFHLEAIELWENGNVCM